MNNIKWDLNDIALVPAEESDINSRSECIIETEWNTLPLMAAPMDTVVSKDNYQIYVENGIIPCIPRGLSKIQLLHKSKYFQSFGLCEIESAIYEYKKEIKDLDGNYEIDVVNERDRLNTCSIEKNERFYHFPNVLIDIANGHMSKLISLIKEIKFYWPDIILMVGNVANSETFINLGMAGADYIRCSVGSGNGCTTAANVSINYPMGSLITECYSLRIKYDIKTQIVADGGMQNYSDIIKALALGADYVMIGSLFNKSIESAGFNYLWGIKLSDKIAKILWRHNFPIKKKYRGMSTKSVQRSWGKTQLVTAEGITKFQKIEYSLRQWVENFKDYTRSAMSYCNAKTLNDFKGKANYIFITEAARKRFLK